MNILFVMDPLDRISVSGDSTYMLMLEATRRKWSVAMCTPEDLFSKQGKTYGLITKLRVTDKEPHFLCEEQREEKLESFDVVWMRKDPPYDLNYVFTTWLLDQIAEPTRVFNHPLGLKLFNEKLFATRFSDFHPKTLVSRSGLQIRSFVEELPGRAVLKPWDGNGGRGVLVTEKEDKNLNSMIELLTEGGKNAILVQEYVPGIEKGDKRILLFDGEPVAGILRVPSSKDHRGNMHVGATVSPCTLSTRDHQIVAAISPWLKKYDQLFVGIDVIDGWLTEINVTSPTGIQEANRLYGLQLEADLLDRMMVKLTSRVES